MTGLKNILAATDFSGPARQAAERAARLASAGGARLHLAHTLCGATLTQLHAWLGQHSAVEDNIIAHTQKALAVMAGELGDAHGLDVEPHLRHGAVLDQLTAQADEIDADLVVLGARGADFMRRFVLGTTAERLLRKSRHPMLVVKQRAHEPYQRVLVAVDFSPWSAPLLALAQRVAPGAHLVLLNACEVPFEGKLRFASVPEDVIENYRLQAQRTALAQLHALAGQAGLKPADWSACTPHADASLAIVEQEQELDCDLIVMGKHGQGMAEELLLGSVTKHVLADAAGDVLISTSRHS